MKWYFLLIGVFIAGCTTTDPKVYDNELVTIQSTPIIRVDPKYPNGDLSLNGHITANLIINESGEVSKVKIIESVPSGVFDKEAKRVLKYWRYRPASLNGKAVKTSHLVRLTWQSRS